MNQPNLNQPQKPSKTDFLINSLRTQLSEAHFDIAQRDALITEQHLRIQELERELAEAQDSLVKELDKQAEAE